MMTVRSGLARSATPVMPFGLPGWTMISSRLVAKIVGSPAVLAASVTFFMLFWSADAKTSAGPPSLTVVARSLDPANTKFALASGLAAVNAAPRSLKAAVSDVAASTWISPLASASAVVVVAAAVVVVAVAAVEVVVSWQWWWPPSVPVAAAMVVAAARGRRRGSRRGRRIVVVSARRRHQPEDRHARHDQPRSCSHERSP